MGTKKQTQELNRQETIKSFMPTIHYWARHYHFQYHQVLELEDLVMVGVIGLIDAMNKFNKEKKTQFKTYAEFRIKGEIIDELRKQDWMTRTDRSKQKKFKKTKNSLIEKLGREPTEKELGNVLHFKRKDLTRMSQYESGDTIKPYIDGETITHNPLSSTEFETYSLKKTLSVLMDELPKTLRLIVTLKYFEDLNFEEISSIVNLSEGRVCQLHAEALKLLKVNMDNEHVDILAA